MAVSVLVRWMWLLSIVVAFAQPVSAQSSLVKGRRVGVKIPPVLYELQEIRAWDATPIYAVEIRRVGSALSVSNNAKWQTAGFPDTESFKIEKISNKIGFTEVELRADFRWLKLRFVGVEAADAFAAVTTPDLDAYLGEASALLAEEYISKPLGGPVSASQIDLVRYAEIAGARLIRSEVYKDKFYVVVNLGSDASTYNDLQFSQASLIAHVLNEDLFKKIKGFASTLRAVDGVFGMKLEFGIPHKSFLDERAIASVYVLHMYAPAGEITQFVEADITSQQFVDRCVVIVDGSRVQVSLASGK